MKISKLLFLFPAIFLLSSCNDDSSSSGTLSNKSAITEPIVNAYTITWKNWDSTILEIDNDVAYGTIPSYNGETPTKEGTAQYTYSFSGWSPNIEQVTNDTYFGLPKIYTHVRH